MDYRGFGGFSVGGEPDSVGDGGVTGGVLESALMSRLFSVSTWRGIRMIFPVYGHLTLLPAGKSVVSMSPESLDRFGFVRIYGLSTMFGLPLTAIASRISGSLGSARSGSIIWGSVLFSGLSVLTVGRLFW